MSDTPEKIGRYEIVAELGKGGMGQVYKARDPNIDRLVAIKVIRLSTRGDEDMAAEMKRRFEQEARAAGVLHHPNIVTIFDAGDTGGVPYIAMEYVEGTTLDELIDPECPVDEERANSIVRQVARGLHAAHEKGIVHRDIKPGNIIVTDDGTAKIMDFGIARVQDSNLTQAGMVIGSPYYMSPEQLTGQGLDGRTDIFSLGVVLYQLITGERPFPGDNPTAVSYRIVRVDPLMPGDVNPASSGVFDEVLKKSLAKRPGDRYPSALAMAEDLERIASGKPVARVGEGNMTATRKVAGAAGSFLKSPWFKWGAGAAAVLLAMTVLVLVSMMMNNPYSEIEELARAGKHDRAVIELLKIRANKPKDHRALYLLGREYARIGDWRSSLLAYGQALKLRSDYRSDEGLQEDILTALSTDQAAIAVSLIVERVGEPIRKKLFEAIEDPDHNLHWNAHKALVEMGEEVDALPLLLMDLKYSPDCEIRKKAVERMGELGDKRALDALAEAERQDWNSRCLGKAIEKAEEKINAANPPVE